MDTVPLASGKAVRLSDPYRPDKSLMPSFRGREDQLRMIIASWIGSASHPPLCPLMVGEPGVGKNRIAYELAAIKGLPLYILQGHEDITAEDLACTVRFADNTVDNGSPNRMEYVLSPLVTAMHKGGICFIDEIGKIRPRALALLVSVLDERRYIDSTLLGERIEAAPAFRFVAATNTGEEYELPEFLRSRLKPVVQVGYPSEEMISDIISAQAVEGNRRKALLKEFSRLWSSRAVRPTPRDIVQLFALAESLSIFRRAGGSMQIGGSSGGQAALRQRGDIAVQDLKAAFKELFGGAEE
jgi:Holliday junction resolvasome RuvABC ATP-dependent DNA helicase subunit